MKNRTRQMMTMAVCMIWPILANPVTAGEPECKGPADCDDANDCTEDSCVEGMCVNTPLPDNTDCDDGDNCTYDDHCDYGVCYGYPQWCTDNDDCTIDYCDPATGCVNEPIDCTDGNPCTDDYCDSDSGQCVNEPNSDVCDDGDPCTYNDMCGEDGCVHGTPVQCPKGQVCDPASGECVPESAFCDDDGDCDDGLYCNGTEQCDEENGVCGGVIAPCPPSIEGCLIINGECDEENDQCLDIPDDSYCGRGEVCTAEGECVPESDSCDDEDGDGKVTICHIPPGNPENAHTITVGVKAVPAHLAHGDHCGACEE